MTASLTSSFGDAHDRVFGGRVWKLTAGTDERHDRSDIDDRSPTERPLSMTAFVSERFLRRHGLRDSADTKHRSASVDVCELVELFD